MYAPVVIFCYNRKEHLKRTLHALEKNRLAEEAEVYIFSDGYKGEKDKKEVEQVRGFLKEYKEGKVPFKELTILEAEKNKGLANNIISGVSETISRYGKIIVLEDDIVTSEDFLEYMNQALDFYEKDENIWSVTGYTLPLKGLKKYREDVYLSYRASSVAWGSWENRWETVDWQVQDFHELSQSKEKQKQLNRGGREMYRMLKAQQEGKNNSWAIRWCYSQSKQNKYTVHPKYCKVQHIGGDGTGENSLATDKYFTEIDITPITLKNIEPDKKILRQFRNYYRLTLKEIWVLGIAKIKRDLKKLWRK